MNNMKRMRGRNHRGGGGGGNPIRHQGGGSGSGGVPLNRNHVFDSSGPDLRVRGTAQQLLERYMQLGRDATGSGDRVMAESYFQHAEHYFRVLNAMTQAQQQGPSQGNGQYQGRRHHVSEPGMAEGPADSDAAEGAPPGFGEQPMADEPTADRGGAEARTIPIAAAPPDA